MGEMLNIKRQLFQKKTPKIFKTPNESDQAKVICSLFDGAFMIIITV